MLLYNASGPLPVPLTASFYIRVLCRIWGWYNWFLLCTLHNYNKPKWPEWPNKYSKGQISYDTSEVIWDAKCHQSFFPAVWLWRWKTYRFVFVQKHKGRKNIRKNLQPLHSKDIAFRQIGISTCIVQVVGNYLIFCSSKEIFVCMFQQVDKGTWIKIWPVIELINHLLLDFEKMVC